MKRSTGGSPLNGGTTKRFERQMPQQQKFHQAQPPFRQQQHYQPGSPTAGRFGNQHQYYLQPPPGMDMRPYVGRPPPPPGPPSYRITQGPPFYNHPPHMWNYNVPPPPIRPPPRLPNRNAALHEHGRIPIIPNTSPARHPLPKPQMPLPPMDQLSEETEDTVVSMKRKRKSMSNRNGCPSDWVREDAVKVIALEEEYTKRTAKAAVLLLRFPDPDLHRDIISAYSPAIETVHFQQNSAPRYCFVHLKEGADVDATIEEVSKIPFGTGFVSAELKRIPPTNDPAGSRPDDVDPCTLYVGNLPTNISVERVKKHFPGAHRIDIGYAQRMKYTRYAFVRYYTVDDAMDGFRRSVNTLLESRSLIVRFRRNRSTINSSETNAPSPAIPTIELENKEAENPAPGGDSVAEATPPKDFVSDSEAAAPQEVVSADSVVTALPSTLPEVNDFTNTFDSPPSSIEEPEIVETESKQNVLSEAEKIKQNLAQEKEQQALKDHQNAGTSIRARRSSLFDELDRRDLLLAESQKSNNTASLSDLPPERIKEEVNALDDDLSEDDDAANNLLGLRYRDIGDQVKTEANEEPAVTKKSAGDEMFPEDFDYDEEFDMEPEEGEDANWPVPSSSKQLPTAPCKDEPLSWESLRQQELSANETKTDVDLLPLGSLSPSSERFIYEERRLAKKSEQRSRPRDEMDDIFAQMNSDAEDDDVDDFYSKHLQGNENDSQFKICYF